MVVVTVLIAVLLGGISACAPAGSVESRGPSGRPQSEEPTAPAEPSPLVFAVIGDFGTDDDNQRAVADLVASWDPEFIVTTGDNYYDVAGGESDRRYEEVIPDYYGRWEPDSFYPVLGNHDYSDMDPAPDLYLDYFDLPQSSSGNERYYDFVRGPVHFYMLNSNEQEPDGTDAESEQAEWLETQLTSSTAPFDVVVTHHPPHSSDDNHGSSEYVRWPFAEWGAEVVVSGHAHTYERILRNDIVYLINGLGGARRYGFEEDPAIGSEVRFNETWGGQRVTATETSLLFEFFDVDGTLIDSYEILSTR